MKLPKTKTIKAQMVNVINGLGIARCECKKVDLDGEVYGNTMVFYDVCLDNGAGDIIESFQRLSSAVKFAKEFRS